MKEQINFADMVKHEPKRILTDYERAAGIEKALQELRDRVNEMKAKAKEQQGRKRRWENAFQRWSDEHGMGDGTESWGACGYGSMCEWCKDNSYGRPCVRALNAMLREKGITLNYTEKFEDIWTSV